METMVWRKANRPQQNKRTLKKTTIKAKRSKISKAIKPTVQGAKAKLRILVEKDI